MKTLFKKIINTLLAAARAVLTSVLGKLLIPTTFILYYLTENWILQLGLLTVLFLATRFNYHGKQLHILKSKKANKTEQLKFNLTR